MSEVQTPRQALLAHQQSVARRAKELAVNAMAEQIGTAMLEEPTLTTAAWLDRADQDDPYTDERRIAAHIGTQFGINTSELVALFRRRTRHS